MLKATYTSYSLKFIVPGGTSRGVLKSKNTYFIYLQNENTTGIGECALFKGLSFDDRPNYDKQLQDVVFQINNGKNIPELIAQLFNWPSIQFGLETAWRSFQSDKTFTIFNNNFVNGKQGIEINGLVWMGEWEFMFQQIKQKLENGFTCIKIKIGAIDFDLELKLLNKIRQQFSGKELEIRVDANGAFKTGNVKKKLWALEKFNLHSIEQPIKQGQIDEMSQLCSNPIIPIALDEELIGVVNKKEKKKLLEQIKPQFIILKPALIGGFNGADEWVSVAEPLNINWWVTSALESNIGLNAIAQYLASKNNKMPQGLGTGQLFSNNIPSPLKLKKNILWYGSSPWNLSNLNV